MFGIARLDNQEIMYLDENGEKPTSIVAQQDQPRDDRS